MCRCFVYKLIKLIKMVFHLVGSVFNNRNITNNATDLYMEQNINLIQNLVRNTKNSNLN